MLNILVCVKQVPDINLVKMDPVTGSLIRAGVPAILNPLDANALEAAVRVKEAHGGTVTVITMGPDMAKEALRECLAAGADRAVLLSDRAFANADTLATSYVIASAAKLLGAFDLIFCGKESLDGATGQMGSQLAERFGASQISSTAKIVEVDTAAHTITAERDLERGLITEEQAQELIDHMVMKFRMVKFARIPSYNQLFSGDPVWATLEVGGIGMDGRSMVTKNCYRFLHTLENMGPAPEPNLTVLYSSALPESFKKYAAKVSIDTSSVQYENDDVMKPVWGDDYSICCCVSATQTGKEMQFFGARANLAKCLLYAINGGVDEKSHEQCGPNYAPITSEYLNYDEVLPKYVQMLDWLAGLYVNVLNLIQYMHDKYYYEEAEMALIDTDVRRTFATGIAGFSHVVDSLSAIKYAKVRTIRDEDGIVTDYETIGDFPRYGNDDDRADDIAVWLLKTFMQKIRQHHTYRDSEPTTSILTITSNVVYGKATGSLPDGRKAGEPLSPGANPSYGAEKSGLLASLNSLAKLPYEWALDGISNTQTIHPDALGHSQEERVDNLTSILDGYFCQGAHHLNVNVFGVEKLIDAMEHPEKEEYANFTIRVSGYAVKFIDLTREQQLDVIARRAHQKM